MAISLHPTLFIGLGTTGRDVLNHVREFTYEEYGVAGLPLNRYISISSDSSDEPSKVFGQQEQDYERIKPVYIVVNSIQDVKAKLDPNNPKNFEDYEGMREWFDRSILEQPDLSVRTGAGGNRQIGRMALWLNWAKFLEEINSLEFNRGDLKNATQEIITRYKNKKSVEIDLDTTELDVIIVTSLVGGTGSGIFHDIAYAVRKNLAGKIGKINVYGFFTILDHTAVVAVDKFDAAAANALAALVELDYCRQNKITIKFPYDKLGDLEMSNPFNQAFLISSSRMTEPDDFNSVQVYSGMNDQYAMRQLLGLNIFLMTMGASLLSLTNAICVDNPNHIPGKIHVRKAGNDPGFLTFINGLGMYAIWFPKNRIADNAAYQAIEQLTTGWLGDKDTTKAHASGIVDDVRQFYNQVLEKARQVLWRDDANSLQEEFSRLLDTGSREIEQEKDLSNLPLLVGNAPSGNSLKEFLKTGGKAERFMDSRTISFRSFFLEKTEYLQNKLKAFLGNTGAFTIMDSRRWLDELLVIINGAIPDYPESPAAFRPGAIVGGEFHTDDIWLKALFINSAIARQEKKKAAASYKKESQRCWESITNWTIRKGLVDVEKKLRKELVPLLEKYEQKIKSIQRLALDSFKKESHLRVEQNQLHIVTMSGESVAKDAQLIAEKIWQLAFDPEQDYLLFETVFSEEDVLDSRRRSLLNQIWDEELIAAPRQIEVLVRIRNKIKDRVLNDFYKQIFGKIR
jgi:hypothetical protein